MTEPGAPTQESPGPRRGFAQLVREDWRYQMGGTIALAMVPRLVYLVQMMGWPFFYSPVLDSRTQYQWAALMLRTFGMGDGAAMSKGPLYTYFLALNQFAVGQGHASVFSARLVQLALGAWVCGLTYLLGRRVFGNRVGLLAGLMAAAYSPTVFEDGELLDTALATFLATVLLLCVLASLEQPSRRRWLGGGVLLGLLGLTRPNLLVLGLWAAVLALVWGRRRRPLRARGAGALWLAVGALAVIAPITARNYAITTQFIPIANNGGINFYTGNNPEADGYSPIAAGVRWQRVQYQVLSANPDMLRDGFTDYRKAEAYWTRLGLDFWREHTSRALALLLKKAYLYWNAYEIPNNLSYDWGRRHASALGWTPLVFGVLGPLALLGMAMRGWRGRQERALVGFVLAQMAAVIAFFVCGRYRMPALPVGFVFAGCALADGAGMVWGRRWGGVAAALAVLAVSAVLVNSDWHGVRRARGANRDWFYVGHSHYFAKRFREAKEAWEQAVKQHPDDADAFSFLGNAEVQVGEYASAARHMRRALELAPDFVVAAGQLAQVHLQQGWALEEPERRLVRAARAQYLYLPAFGTLARVHIRMGRLEEAGADLQRAAEALDRVTPVGKPGRGLDSSLAQAMQEAHAAGVPVPERLLRAGLPFAPR